MSFQKNKFTVRRYGKLMKFASWIQGIPSKITPPPFRLLQISSQFWQSRALYVAAALDVATVLSDQTLPYDDIAKNVSADSDAIYRLMRMLAAMGIFEETKPGFFKNNKVSDFLREDKVQNVRAMVLMHNSDEMSRPWYESLLDGVKRGDPPFKLTHGSNIFDYMDQHSDFDALFSKAMDCVEVLMGNSFATDFDWARFKRIIDVGGSKGAKSVSILKQHPNLEALVFDRPQVIGDAEAYWSEREDQSLLSRIDFQSGDMLSSVPKAKSDKDVYFLCAVLHGFDDETCVRVLRNLVEASDGLGVHIALMEMVLDDYQADLTATTFDMQMFMGTEGRERTLNEWLSIIHASGLALREVVSLRTFGKILLTQVETR